MGWISDIVGDASKKVSYKRKLWNHEYGPGRFAEIILERYYECGTKGHPVTSIEDLLLDKGSENFSNHDGYKDSFVDRTGLFDELSRINHSILFLSSTVAFGRSFWLEEDPNYFRSALGVFGNSFYPRWIEVDEINDIIQYHKNFLMDKGYEPIETPKTLIEVTIFLMYKNLVNGDTMFARLFMELKNLSNQDNNQIFREAERVINEKLLNHAVYKYMRGVYTHL